jgi:SAM-dependent methyltransferase
MKIVDRLVSLFVAGRCWCPVCEKKVRRFLPLSSHYRKNLIKYGGDADFSHYETLNWRNYSCPHCGASDRDRLYALYIKNKFISSSMTDEMSFVDFAPSAPLARLVRSITGICYRSADIAMKDVDDCVDLMDLHIYPDQFCDFFLCSHVLEHVPDDRRAMRELFRILKPGGEGILMVPIVLTAGAVDEDPDEMRESERWRRFGQDDHIRKYTKKGFLERLKESGFLVKELGVDFFGIHQFDQAAITPQSVLYVVSKH